MLVGSTGHGSGIPAPPPRPWRPFFSSSHHSLASSTRPPAAASAAKAEDDDAPAAAAAALAAYEDAYFNAATPLISDDAYDALKAKASRQKRKGRGVGAAPSPASALPKAAHPARLLSLDAVHSRAEAEAWGARAAARPATVAASAGATACRRVWPIPARRWASCTCTM